jgi:hypothetical protein
MAVIKDCVLHLLCPAKSEAKDNVIAGVTHCWHCQKHPQFIFALVLHPRVFSWVPSLNLLGQLSSGPGAIGVASRAEIRAGAVLASTELVAKTLLEML